MRNLVIFLVLGFSVVSGEEPQPKTIGEAEKMFNREYNDAKDAFDARVKIAQDKFVLLLKEEMKKLTTKGDLDGAVAVREKIKVLESNDRLSQEKVTENEDKSIMLVGRKLTIVDTKHKVDKIMFSFGVDHSFTRNKSGNQLDKSGKYFFDGKTLTITPLSNSVLIFVFDTKMNTFKCLKDEVTVTLFE